MILGDLITKNLILLGVEAGTKEEALRQTSGLLQSQGYVKETFYSALLEREAEYPTDPPRDAGTCEPFRNCGGGAEACGEV